MKDKKTIDFEITRINEEKTGRFDVEIKYINPTNDKEDKQVFNFPVSEQIEDRFLDKIKKSLDDQFNTSVKVTSDRFLGKKFTHEFGR